VTTPTAQPPAQPDDGSKPYQVPQELIRRMAACRTAVEALRLLPLQVSVGHFLVALAQAFVDRDHLAALAVSKTLRTVAKLEEHKVRAAESERALMDGSRN